MPTTYAEPTGAKITYEGGEGISVSAEQPYVDGQWELRVGTKPTFNLGGTVNTIRRLVTYLGELQEVPAPVPLVVSTLHSQNPDHTSRTWRAENGVVYEYLPNKPYGAGAAFSATRGFWTNLGMSWGGTDPSYLGPFTEILK